MYNGSYANGDIASLISDREREILILIAHEYTTCEIADMLYISEHTVKTHRKNLIEKLHVRSLAGLVRIACRSGLVL